MILHPVSKASGKSSTKGNQVDTNERRRTLRSTAVVFKPLTVKLR